MERVTSGYFSIHQLILFIIFPPLSELILIIINYEDTDLHVQMLIYISRVTLLMDAHYGWLLICIQSIFTIKHKKQCMRPSGWCGSMRRRLGGVFLHFKVSRKFMRLYVWTCRRSFKTNTLLLNYNIMFKTL